MFRSVAMAVRNTSSRNSLEFLQRSSDLQQFGNSVVVPLMENVAKLIVKKLAEWDVKTGSGEGESWKKVI